MSSLIDIVGSDKRASDGSVDGRGRAALGRFVPRFWRVFLRHATRYLETTRPVPQGIGSVLALGFLLSGWSYGAAVGGYGPVLLGGLASSVGLKATDIIISGQVETQEADIATALDLQRSGTLIGFDISKARTRVLSLPWVRDAALRKVYPGKLLVVVSEHRPAAVWQFDEHLTVVRKSGDVITKFGISELLNNRFAHLPHLVGKGAAASASEILPIASRYPKIVNRIASYQRIADRRWDVILRNGIQVQLPEYGHENALSKIAALQKSRQLLDRELTTVDARMDGRLVVRLTQDAKKDHADLVAARAKAIKKADQNKERHL